MYVLGSKVFSEYGAFPNFIIQFDHHVQKTYATRSEITGEI